MPYSKEHKHQSRQRILESAAKLFINQGYENTSIDDIMTKASMTRGAFYAHFSTKSELYSQAILFAASNKLLALPKPDGMPEKVLINKFLKGYLSLAHVHKEEMPCPMAFLVTDVVNRDPQVRNAYTRIFKGMNRNLTRHTREFSTCTADTVMAVSALMIGGVAIARALDDPATTKKLLRSCRQVAESLLQCG